VQGAASGVGPSTEFEQGHGAEDVERLLGRETDVTHGNGGLEAGVADIRIGLLGSLLVGHAGHLSGHG
jgi:hypothetical protein